MNRATVSLRPMLLSLAAWFTHKSNNWRSVEAALKNAYVFDPTIDALVELSDKGNTPCRPTY